LKARGKVRDIYDLGDILLIVATDRIFAFDVIMPNPIPGKGRILTPDSSRFWPKNRYRADGPQPRLDKQFLRDYLLSLSWPKQLPAAQLPPKIVEKTRKKYREVLRRLTGVSP
jgi:phosphoribosylaminoimidazole-succinocarboxamide synthase